MSALGYMIEGKVTFTYSDGKTETYETGDAYFAPPGHTPTLYAGSEIVEFHPTEQLKQMMDVVTRNMEQASWLEPQSSGATTDRS